VKEMKKDTCTWERHMFRFPKERKLLLSSPIPEPLDDLNNTEKLSNNSEITEKNTNLQWIILFALAIIIIMLILLYTDAVL
jgi:ABC-type uncharacterized transport system permease subunit